MLIPTIQWTPLLAIRERFERRTNREFSSAINDDRSTWSTRVTAGTSFRHRNFSGQFVYNFNRDSISSVAGNTVDDRSDLQLGFLRFEDGGGEWTVGRQQIKKGSERLMGEGTWNAVSIAWDGIRYRQGEFDFWAARLGAANRGSSSTRTAGMSYKSSFGETIYFFRHTVAAFEKVDAHTLNHLVTVARGNQQLTLEGAVQLGTRSTFTGNRVLGPAKSLKAWATAARYTVRVASKLSVAVEGSAASGGSNDCESFTFDNSLASNHALYGTMDVHGWKNSQALAILVNFKPRADISVDLGYHRFGLRDAADAWYSSGGAPNPGFVDLTGSKGRDVGQELDLQAGFTLTPRFTLTVGVSTFRPGAFIRAFRGANTTDQNWLFMQAIYRY